MGLGIKVVPKNLNDRQMKRVDKIESPERARRVASRISDRRNARGAENPQLAKKPIMKSGGMAKKAKSGASFPDLNKDGKITKADILKGRGVIAKSGMKMKKQAATAIAMKKAGVAPKKMMKRGGMMKKGC